MSKGSGSTRSKGPTSGRMPYSAPTAGEYIPVTDRGMNDKQRAYITAFERSRRNSGVERGLSVDKYGNIVRERKGSTRSIIWYDSEIPKDGVLTHVHPIAKSMRSGKMGDFAKSIGKSFSGQDIRTAIKRDLKEIRAVTPNYTFSMRRPASGWGVSPDDFFKAYNTVWKLNRKKMIDYANAGGDVKSIYQRYGRLNVALDHQTMRELAKAYGFIYHKSKRIK